MMPPPGPTPAQIHNAMATAIMLYGTLLDQQQRTIDLLTAQNRELQGQIQALRKEVSASMHSPSEGQP